MKKWAFFFFLFFCSFPMAAQDSMLRREIQKSTELLSRAFLNKYPDLTVKRGAAILDFKEESPQARSKKMGTLVRVYLEEALSNSMVLYLVDRKNLGEIKEEMVLSLSGLVDEGTAPEIGFLSGTHALLYGTIVEEGADFRISISLTDVTSGELLLTHSFTIPNREMVAAALDLQYEYVAKNGIGLSVANAQYILANPIFNKSLPMFISVDAKYRISRNFMLSAGVMTIPAFGGEFYRWDPSEFPDQYHLHWSFFQPDLPSPLDGEIGQITASINRAVFFHLDGQVTFNISPQFNIGIRLGAVIGPGIQIDYRHAATGGLFSRTEAFDPTGDPPEDIITRDYQDLLLSFGLLYGGKIEICPEIFITPRLAVSGIAGYILTNKAEPRLAFASNGDWGFYKSALESRYNESAEKAYFGLDPRIMPDGTVWAMDLSGLYAGFSLSFFF